MTRAVSYILAFVEFPVSLSPAFARMDLSDFPVLVGAFAFGPVSGIMIELVKNGLQMLSTSTGGVGELANFLIGASFVWAAGFIYRFHKTKKMAWVSCIAGSFIMGIVTAAANYFILLPMFEVFMPLDQVIASFGAFIPFIRTKLDVVLFNVLPFNVLKGLVIGDTEAKQTGYFAGQGCIGCKLCYSVCPQKCIDISGKPVVIDQNRCLHCGRCAEICPKQVIEKRS